MKPLVVANWKMNPLTLKGAKLLFDAVKRGVKDIKNAEIVICPPFIYLSNIRHPKPEHKTKGFVLGRAHKYGLWSNINLGAQDCFWEEKGAFTGKISPLMLKDLGVEYVILGHSERRKLGETDEMINKKIKAALKVKLKPILCIGETEMERKAGKTKKILEKQLEILKIQNLKSNIQNLIIAYEPVWAIGTGNPCEPKEAKKVYLFLRKILKKIPILYGGSANSENAASYIQEANFQGLLVGGASLKAKEFIKIIKNVAKT